MTDAPAKPAPDPHNQKVEINPTALGVRGHYLLGKVEATKEAARQVLEWSRRTIDLGERRTLLNTARALHERSEALQLELANYALQRGAATIAKPKLQS